MKAIFIMALVCVLMSVLALIGVSAMTIVPGPGAESFRDRISLAAGVSLIVWLGVALWAGVRQGAVTESSPPRWVRRLLLVFSIVYLLGSFTFFLG